MPGLNFHIEPRNTLKFPNITMNLSNWLHLKSSLIGRLKKR